MSGTSSPPRKDRKVSKNTGDWQPCTADSCQRHLLSPWLVCRIFLEPQPKAQPLREAGPRRCDSSTPRGASASKGNQTSQPAQHTPTASISEHVVGVTPAVPKCSLLVPLPGFFRDSCHSPLLVQAPWHQARWVRGGRWKAAVGAIVASV